MIKLGNYISLVLLSLMIMSCSNSGNAIPTTEFGQKMYHEIGDTFEFQGPESGLPFKIKVKDVWSGNFEEHEQYISEKMRKPDNERIVMFISYTVTNKGEEVYEFIDDRFYPNNDVLPNLITFSSFIFDVDIAYSEASLINDMEDVTDLTLSPGESLDIEAAVITNKNSLREGAFVWDYDADIPQVIFTRSQSERRDQIGVYDIGDPIYIEDETDTLVNVRIKEITDIKSDEPIEEIEREYESSAFLIIDLVIENEGKTDINIISTFPVIDLGYSTFSQTNKFIKQGEVEPIKGLYSNSEERPADGVVRAGETLEGTFYYEVENNLNHEVLTLDAQVFYRYSGFKDYPYYQQWVNYNLE